MSSLTRIQFDNIQDDTIRPVNLDISNPGAFGPNDIVTLAADGEHFEIIPNFGADWNGLQLDKLKDITIDFPVLDGQILEFSSSENQWKNVSPGAASLPSMSLNDLLDVTEAGSVDGEVLVYDFGITQYVNKKLDYVDLDNIPVTFAPQAHSHSIAHINDYPFSSPPVSSDLADINLTGLVVGNILEWNGVAFVPGSKATGVSVDSIFSRTGAVLAEPGDYDTDEVTNESVVPGAFVTDALNALNVAIASATTTFIGLTDTPNDFIGSESKLVAVNALGTALEFVSTVGVDSVFGRVGTIVAMDGDYVSSQIDNNSVILGGAGTVSDALNSINVSLANKAEAFTDLSDTPVAITIGDADKLVAINATGDGIIFIDPVASGVAEFNNRSGLVFPATSDYDASQVDNDSGVAGAFVSDALDTLDIAIGNKPDTFIDLSDTPASMSAGDANKHLAVNGAGTALEFISAPVIPIDSVFGRTGAVAAVAGDYDASQVDNDSGVVGAFVSDALDTLDTLKADSSSVPTSIGDLTDVNLTGTVNTSILAWDSPSSNFIAVPQPISGATIFTELIDSPPSYAGHGGKHVAVTLAESGIEFVDVIPDAIDSVFGRLGVIVAEASDYSASQVDNDSVVAGAYVSDALDSLNTLLGGKANVGSVPTDFTDLLDTPADYTASGSKIVAVNIGGTGLEFVDPVVGGAVTFLDLSDGPAAYTGQSNKIVTVNGAETGLEFTSALVASVHGRTGVVVSAASDYDASQVDNNSGVAGAFVSDALDTLDTALGNKPDAFVDLTDTPASIEVGDAGKYVAINGAGTGIVFLTPPVFPTNVSAFTNDSGYISDITAESINDLTDVDLTNIQDTYVLEWDTPSGKFVAVAAPSVGAVAFSDLTDTPASIEVGDADKYVTVNGAGDGIVFLTPPTIPTNVSDLANDSGFISDITAENLGDLVDVNLSGIQDTYILEWDTDTSNFIAVAAPSGSTTFAALTDTPADFTGHGDKYVAVNSGGTALEFITPPTIPTNVSDLANDSGFISDITAENLGDLVDVNLSGIQDTYILEWDTDTSNFIAVAAPSGSTTFAALTDTPADFTGHGDKYVAVNSGGTALEFITPPTIPTNVSDLANDSGFISDITAENIGDLFDVNLTGIQNAYVLEWDDVSSEFIVVAPPGGAVNLDDLSDVTIVTADTGDLIRYNGVAWVDYSDDNYATGAEGDLATSALQSVSDDLAPVLGASLDVGAFSIISSTTGDIAITPDTTGSIVLDGLSWPQADGSDTYMLVTDGAGQLSWAAQGSAGTFAALTDTPASIVVGDANKYVAVNAGGTALEFITPPTIPTNVSDLVNDSGFISDITNEQIGDLDNVNLAGILDGYILEWDSASSEFIAVPSPAAGSTFTGLSDTPADFTGQANKVVAVNSGETALEYVSPTAGSGFETEWIKIPYTGGNLVNTGAVTTSSGISVAFPVNTLNTDIRMTITFNGTQTKPPSSIMSYGYIYNNNNYKVQALDLTIFGSVAVLEPGGVSGTPGDILNSFATMTIEDIQISTSATGASFGGPPFPTHAILIIGW